MILRNITYYLMTIKTSSLMNSITLNIIVSFGTYIILWFVNVDICFVRKDIQLIIFNYKMQNMQICVTAKLHKWCIKFSTQDYHYYILCKKKWLEFVKKKRYIQSLFTSMRMGEKSEFILENLLQHKSQIE